jgi:uncharacterized membrane protein YeaQ/YmgE (transglycosylase-associated protein family)
MGFVGFIVSLVIVGFIVGSLGRLVVPGPNPIGLKATLGIGLAGALLGGLIGGALGFGALSIVFEVAIAAGLVHAFSGRYRSLTPGGRR